MATFITTIRFTEQGIKSIRETTKRAAAFKSAVKKLNVKVSGQYWTLGAFDGLEAGKRLLLFGPAASKWTITRCLAGRTANGLYSSHSYGRASRGAIK